MRSVEKEEKGETDKVRELLVVTEKNAERREAVSVDAEEIEND